jgi:Phytanoyl-CoA dioxygenase (PhyH)/SEC-C motif
MDLAVAVSPRETASGALSPETATAANATFREHGCVLLRGALAPSIIEDMHGEFVSQFGGMDLPAMQAEVAKPPPNRFLMVGDARYDITLRMTGAFGRPEVFANPLLIGFLQSLLGPEMQLSNFTVVAAHPDAPQQHVHRDCGHLFAEPGVGPNLPVYALNVAVPLIDVGLETGPTQVWPGTHRLNQGDFVTVRSGKSSAMQRGDCMLMDYRTLHAGGHNISGRMRPILYMVYARPWFFDQINHLKRIPLDMPPEHYEALPQSVRPLLIRAFSFAMRARWHETDARVHAASRGASAGPGESSSRHKVGRNDPCPCGSGRKYKRCHGQAVGTTYP